jgi:N-acetyl-anhydromuramyl-L-alanine amidase AmpD
VLIVGGREVACGAPVSEWLTTGIAFRGLPARKKTTKIVLHWTGGLGDAQQVHDTLTERGLSVHFCVDAAGRIWQYCDASSLCAHAGRLDDGVTSANLDTIGIEIVNHAGHEQRGVERPMVTEQIQGRRLTHTDFLPAQIVSALALCEALCAAYGLPMDVPMQSGVLATRALLRAAWERHRGVVGHYHARSAKSDPGLAILQAIAHQQRVGHQP